ncbi:unnamed protein product [Rotaria socialis]|uniref:Uncharacterized protein n=1 Tax=Rotaria socialis TaxID=392032 RepID=A0A820YW73_9BILA|nr:unnamed protein product [Rotaria socialis]CAF3301910.1 unnamed protein product [Rotaria socialis]CAF3384401.1 unnamed protein product [Rotaria socialis]CAF4446395.1 unnamed protein product [Rotaria socialis]CAF4554667.1 unnamed protein product [Rotaria socialis]
MCQSKNKSPPGESPTQRIQRLEVLVLSQISKLDAMEKENVELKRINNDLLEKVGEMEKKIQHLENDAREREAKFGDSDSNSPPLIKKHQNVFLEKAPGRTYTVVYDGKSPYLAVLHGSVLRS